MNIPPRMKCNAATCIKTTLNVFSDHLGIPTLTSPSFQRDKFEDTTVLHQAYVQKPLYGIKIPHFLLFLGAEVLCCFGARYKNTA